jgi:hypothetical protein
MKIKLKKILHPLFKRKTISTKQENNAVSEIIATILLLSISLALLCVVYLFVFNNATNPSSTSHASTAELLASADEYNVYLENKGGAPLSLNTKLIITIGGQDFMVSAKDYVIDTNGDGEWSIGEPLIFNPISLESIYGLEVRIQVINLDTNSMIMVGLVQEGARGDQPFVQTLTPYNVWPHSATLKSYYNFINSNFLPGKFWFQWKRSDATQWTITPMMNITTAPLSGFQELTLYNLTSNKNYLFEALIQYTSGNTTLNQSGGIKLFTTQIDAMGIWHFDEPSGLTFFDSSGQYPPNDGVLKPNENRGPQRVDAELNHSMKYLSLDGIDDYGQVPNSFTLGVTDECTIEAWINRSEHCEGLIGKPVQSSLSQFGFYTSGCYDPYILHVTGTIYAVVSTNENSLGYIGTVNITNTGSIIENISTASCYIDLFNFESSCRNPKMIRVNGSDGILAIVYTRPGSSNQLYLKTVQIYDDGRIKQTAVDTRLLDTTLSSSPDVISISNNVYAIVYGINAASEGVLISVDISTTGMISAVNNKILFGDIMIDSEIIKIVRSTNIYVIVYNCIGDDGGLRTVRITDTGGLSEISSHVYFDDDDAGQPEILHLKDDVYAIVYAGPILRQTGILKTIEILPDGTITLSRTIPPLARTIDQLAFESLAGSYIRSPFLLPITGSDDFYGICYSVDSSTTNLWGRIITIKIQGDGKIVTISRKDVIFEPFLCSSPYIIPIANEIYSVVYRGDARSGVIKTIRIRSDGHIGQNPILAMSELGSLKCYAQDEILTSDGKYVVNVFRGIDARLMIKTVQVDPITKTIANTFTDSFTIEEGYTSTNGTYNASYEPTIISISTNVYAIAYSHYMTQPSFRNGKIITVRVDAAGRITPIVRFTFDTNCMNTPFSFMPIDRSNSIYAVTYQLASTSQGKIATIKIADDGSILGVIDSFVFETVRCREPSMVQVSGDIYAIIYRDSTTSSTYGRIATLQIYGTNGTIRKSVVDSWQLVTSCYRPDIIKVAPAVYACVYSQYTSSRYYAYVRTLRIADNGVITKSFIDSLAYMRQYYTNNYLVHHPKIFHVSGRVYGIISKDLPDPWGNLQYFGWITTFRIGENGDIIDSADGKIQISSNPRIESYDIKIIPFVDDSYIALYGGVNNDLYQCVIRIPLVGTTQTIFSKLYSYTIEANKTTVFVTFTDSNNQKYTLSAILKDKWNHIVTTYDKTTMNLYLNTNHVASLPLNNKPIRVTTNNLLFGPYNAQYDQFSLYAAILSPAKILQSYNYYRQS